MNPIASLTQAGHDQLASIFHVFHHLSQWPHNMPPGFPGLSKSIKTTIVGWFISVFVCLSSWIGYIIGFIGLFLFIHLPRGQQCILSQRHCQKAVWPACEQSDSLWGFMYENMISIQQWTRHNNIILHFELACDCYWSIDGPKLLVQMPGRLLRPQNHDSSSAIYIRLDKIYVSLGVASLIAQTIEQLFPGFQHSFWEQLFCHEGSLGTGSWRYILAVVAGTQSTWSLHPRKLAWINRDWRFANDLIFEKGHCHVPCSFWSMYISFSLFFTTLTLRHLLLSKNTWNGLKRFPSMIPPAVAQSHNLLLAGEGRFLGLWSCRLHSWNLSDFETAARAKQIFSYPGAAACCGQQNCYL